MTHIGLLVRSKHSMGLVKLRKLHRIELLENTLKVELRQLDPWPRQPIWLFRQPHHGRLSICQRLLGLEILIVLQWILVFVRGHLWKTKYVMMYELKIDYIWSTGWKIIYHWDLLYWRFWELCLWLFRHRQHQRHAHRVSELASLRPFHEIDWADWKKRTNFYEIECKSMWRISKQFPFFVKWKKGPTSTFIFLHLEINSFQISNEPDFTKSEMVHIYWFTQS